MTNTSSDTAILVFARAAKQEVKQKTFSGRHKKRANRKIAQALLDHTLSVVKESGLPVIPYFSDRQRGQNFGERLANAFHDAFQEGYQKVICIGSDCPFLEVHDLLQAQEQLQDSAMVVGPAADGGAYLIGMDIDSFSPHDFAILNWQTAEVQSELSMYIYRLKSSLSCIAMLAEKSDIDTAEDFERLLQQLPLLHGLKKELLRIVMLRNSIRNIFRHRILKPLNRQVKSLLLRAPPFA